MEFLNINLTKDFIKKSILFSGFKNPYTKIPDTRKLESIHYQHFIEHKNEGGKPVKNSSLRRLDTSTKNVVQ